MRYSIFCKLYTCWGYHMTVQGYKFYLWELTVSLTIECNEGVRDIYQHKKIKFVSWCSHLIFCFLYNIDQYYYFVVQLVAVYGVSLLVHVCATSPAFFHCRCCKFVEYSRMIVDYKSRKLVTSLFQVLTLSLLLWVDCNFLWYFALRRGVFDTYACRLPGASAIYIRQQVKQL